MQIEEWPKTGALPFLCDYHWGRHKKLSSLWHVCQTSILQIWVARAQAIQSSPGSDKDPQVVKIVVSQFGAEWNCNQFWPSGIHSWQRVWASRDFFETQFGVIWFMKALYSFEALQKLYILVHEVHGSCHYLEREDVWNCKVFVCHM